MDEISRIPFKVVIEGVGEARGEFIRFLAPRTVDGLLRLLPLQGRVAFLREQVYFQVPLKMGTEKGVERVEEGDVAYWPIAGALCVFTGGMKPHAPVNLVGRVLSGLDAFKKAQSGMPIRVERLIPS